MNASSHSLPQEIDIWDLPEPEPEQHIGSELLCVLNYS
jgi:hypothetical protein